MRMKKDNLANLLSVEETIKTLENSQRTGMLASFYMRLMREPVYDICASDQPAVEAVYRIFTLGGDDCEEFLENIRYGVAGAFAQPRLTFYGKRFPKPIETFIDLALGYRQTLGKIVKHVIRRDQSAAKQAEDLVVYAD